MLLIQWQRARQPLPTGGSLSAPRARPTWTPGGTPVVGVCLGLTLAALRREKLSVKNTPHLGARPLGARWVPLRALFRQRAGTEGDRAARGACPVGR